MLPPCPDEIRRQLLACLAERFGFDTALLEPYELYLSESARQKIFLGPKTDFPLARTDTGGVLIARAGATIKPATSFFQLFGRHVTRNIIHLERGQVAPFCSGSDLELAENQIGGAERGFVMVVWEEHCLGCGLLKGRTLENQIPKANRLTLEQW